MVDGIADPFHHIRQGSKAVGIQHPHGHDLGLEGNTCHAQGVVGGLGKGASHMGAVAVEVGGILIVIYEVVALHKFGLGQIRHPRHPVSTTATVTPSP
jgi:hypothetical protein